MYAHSRPTTPFIPPPPGASPAANAPVIPPTPPDAHHQTAAAGWAHPAAGAAPAPQWAGVGWGTPYQGRGRRNSYNGMPLGAAGGPPYDAGAFYGGFPAVPMPGAYATPAAAVPRGLGLDYAWAGMDQQNFLHPAGYGPGQPTPVIPPRPHSSHSRSRSRSRGPHYNSDGLPDDWIGPRLGQPAAAMPPTVPVPPEFADHVQPGTPWYAFPSQIAMQTPYSGFEFLPGGGAAHAPRHRRGHSTHTTPWIGGGYLPVETEDYQYDRAVRPEHRSGMVDTRWFTGKDYGPVLDPLLAGIVRCTFKVNPLLRTPPDDQKKRPYLTWNMLFTSAYVHRSDERPNQSWMKGRDAPATFPRLSHIRIISRSFPWFIDVRAYSSRSHYAAGKGSEKEGVTCGDVIDALSAFFLVRTGAEEYHSLPPVERRRVGTAYHHNRSIAPDVPGGRLGEGMLRCDFLGDHTMWGGLEVDQRYVNERLQISSGSRREASNVFVLHCDTRLPMSDDERRDQAARGASAAPRAASRAPSANE